MSDQVMSERIESLKGAIRRTATREELDLVLATFPPSAMTPAERADLAAFLRRRGAAQLEHADELRRYSAERAAARPPERGADE